MLRDISPIEEGPRGIISFGLPNSFIAVSGSTPFPNARKGEAKGIRRKLGSRLLGA